MQLELLKHLPDLTNECRPPLRYPGSKYNAIKIIKNYLPIEKFDFYCEPFFGSGAFFFKMVKTKSNLLNDSDRELMNFYKTIKNKKTRNKLIDKVVTFNPTKSNFEKLKKKIPESNFESACKYFIINRTAYSGIMNKPNWGYHPERSVTPNKWAQRLEVSGEKLKNSKMFALDFREFFQKNHFNKKTFIFIDPPYFLADQKRAYVESFNEQDHIDLSIILKKIKAKFLLTYDECDEIKKLYSWAYKYPVSWRYHTSNSNRATRKKGKEIIITNYKVL